MQLTAQGKINFALFIALLFHISGAIGILFTPYKDWFIANTPLNILLMAALIIFTQPEKNTAFFSFFAVVFTTGLLAEITGVNTGLLFGNYAYGKILGLQVAGAPLIIGINWFIVIYCTGTTTCLFEEWIIKKMEAETQLSPKIKSLSFIVDAALLATLFDWIIEPAAIKLGYWQWDPPGVVPFYNYLCWLFISAFLLLIFKRLNFSRHNQFAVHLLIIQVLFFVAIRILL